MVLVATAAGEVFCECLYRLVGGEAKGGQEVVGRRSGGRWVGKEAEVRTR